METERLPLLQVKDVDSLSCVTYPVPGTSSGTKIGAACSAPREVYGQALGHTTQRVSGTVWHWVQPGSRGKAQRSQQR